MPSDERPRPKAEHAANLHEAVLEMVSHDLRSPLNTIALCVSLLRDEVSADGRKLVDRIEGGVARMELSLVNLSIVPAIEQGTLTVLPVRMRAAPIVREAADAATSMADARRCRIEQETFDETAEVLADREQLLQVFANILGETIRSSPEGSVVILGAEFVGEEVAFFADGRVPRSTARPLETPVARSKSDPAPPPHETSLALYVARGLVEAHGGRILVEAGLEAGVRVTFSLPTGRGIVPR